MLNPKSEASETLGHGLWHDTGLLLLASELCGNATRRLDTTKTVGSNDNDDSQQINIQTQLMTKLISKTIPTRRIVIATKNSNRFGLGLKEFGGGGVAGLKSPMSSLRLPGYGFLGLRVRGLGFRV